MFDFLRARRRALLVVAASATAVLLASCGGGDEDTPPLFRTMVVFGASVSDNGNACNLSATNCPTPSPPYASGRFSNGPLWIDTVAARYGAAAVPSRQGGNNWAYAGARTGTVPGVTTPPAVPSMAAQLEQYLQRVGYISQAQTLFVVDSISVGSNIVDALTLAASNPNAPTQVLTQAVTDIATMLLRLYASGARHILVLNSTNVGRTPRAQALGAAAVAGATQLSAQFNGALAQQIAGLRATSPGLNIYTVDVFALSEQAAANPASLGFTNATAACFNTTAAPPTLCANPSQYFYWDTFHPTQAAGAILADRAIAAIDG